MPMNGKSVLVTGGACRIGREIALAVAAAGADVAFTYLSSASEARQTIDDLKARGVRGLALQCDLRQEESVAAALRQLHAKFGGLDVLVNNAGAYDTIDFEEITARQWDEMFAINTRGPFLTSRLAAPMLRERKGRIINIGSLGGLRPWASHAHYCASKAALIMLTQVTAKALAPHISVNCVSPGMISTGNSQPTAFLRQVAQKTPMKRAGTPGEVAAAVMFFATGPHFITGQMLGVDGGLGLES
ncbi:MAG TPA: SDR family NAD(P)-dependent oxidoreductase [Terriglobales bacterium]|nr:SDR family NAD(P)-dependent oxidoreductase [Terriglobales bacterium]